MIKGYEVGGPIGFGAGGAAVAVRDRDGRSLAAVMAPRDARLERLEGLATLRHPNLPRIRDVVAAGDQAAVVMDLVVGPSLATLVNARSWLSRGEVATLWRTIGDALAALHHRGLVHGDVSPANIVVGPDGTPVLVDIVGHGGTERGHTGYIPPELDDGPATEASDIWSLARTLTWASGEDADVVRHVGRALAEDPVQRPTARDFATWSHLLGEGAELVVPTAADLAGAQLRSAAAPTVLQEERVSLTGQVKRLEDEAHQLVEEAEMGDVQFDDEGGEGDTMVVERERDLALSAQAREAVEEIDAAIERIMKGTYG
ncbi:MAG: protein kinase, partial [Actinomycetes bacterium]|nr:protein kinase [Actinomycetes bacterium]